MSAPAAAGQDRRAAGGAWRESLAVLYPVPAPHRVEDVDRRTALEMLRCGPEVLDRLVADGLPHTGRADGPWFDRHDLVNLALQSGSGWTMPERAVQFALRWMREDPKTWTEPLEWTYEIGLSCDRCEGGEFRHSRLLPERHGGTLVDQATTPPAGVDGGDLVWSGPATVAGRLVTGGSLLSLRSPRLTAVTLDFLGAGYRWARLPKPVQADYETVMAAGYAPCVTASLFLEREYRAAGYEAFARSGWILGMLDLAHAWVEVIDDDGVRKVVDPALERLSTHSGDPHPGLGAAALGARSNRMLPTAAGAGQPQARHTCPDGTTAAAKTRTIIRRTGAQ